MRLSGVAIVAAGLLLSGCATPVPVHEYLPNAAHDKLSSTEVVLPIKQGEIYVFVPDSQIAAAGGGGLLLALIDAGVNSVRTSKAEAAIKPLRDVLVDFDFDSALRDDIRTSLSAVSWVHVTGARVVRDASITGTDAALAQSSAATVLFANTDYQLSNDADVLTVTLSAQLFPKEQALAALHQSSKSGAKTAIGNSIYRDNFVFKMNAPPAADRDHYIAEWSVNKGAPMRAALKLAATKLSGLLAVDFQRAEGDVSPAPNDADGGAMRAIDGTYTFTARPTF